MEHIASMNVLHVVAILCPPFPAPSSPLPDRFSLSLLLSLSNKFQTIPSSSPKITRRPTVVNALLSVLINDGHMPAASLCWHGRLGLHVESDMRSRCRVTGILTRCPAQKGTLVHPEGSGRGLKSTESRGDFPRAAGKH